MQGQARFECEGDICMSSIGFNRSPQFGRLIFERRNSSKWVLNVIYGTQKREKEIELSKYSIKMLPSDFESVCDTGSIRIPFNCGNTITMHNGRRLGAFVVGGLANIGRLLLGIKNGHHVGLLGGGGGESSCSNNAGPPAFGNEVHDMFFTSQPMTSRVNGNVTPPRPHAMLRPAGVSSAPPAKHRQQQQHDGSGDSWHGYDKFDRCGRNSYRGSSPRGSGGGGGSVRFNQTGQNSYGGGGHHHTYQKSRNVVHNGYNSHQWSRGNHQSGNGQHWANHGGTSGNSYRSGNGGRNGRARERNQRRNQSGRVGGRGGASSSYGHSQQQHQQASHMDGSYRQRQSSQPLKDRGSAENSLDRSGSDRSCDDMYKNNDRQHGGSGNSMNESPSRKHSIGRDENARPDADCYSPRPRRHSSSNRSPTESTPSNDSSGSVISRSRFYGNVTPKQLYPVPSPISTSSKSNFQGGKRQTLLPMPTPPKKAKLNLEDERDKENRVSLNHTFTRNRTTKLSGFKNLGNTCYMNAILQSLYCLDYFSKDLLTIYQHIESILPKKSLYRSICELLKEKEKPNSSHAHNFFDSLLANLKDSVEHLFRSFAGHNMQDAHEFVTRMLDHLKDEVDNMANTLGETIPRTGELGGQLDNPVKRHFEFETIEKYKCTKCSNVVSKKQVAYDLGVFVPKPRKQGLVRSLQLVLDSSFQTEKREFRCEKCEHNESMVEVQISRLPRILSVHLKRYMMTGSHIIKNDAPLIIPKYLTMKDHTCEDAGLSHTIDSTTSTMSLSSFSEECTSSTSESDSSPDSHDGECVPHTFLSATVHMTSAGSGEQHDHAGGDMIRLTVDGGSSEGVPIKEPVFGLCGGQGPVAAEPAATDEPFAEGKTSSVLTELEPVICDPNSISEEEMKAWDAYDPRHKEDATKEEDEDEDLQKAKMLSLQDLELKVEVPVEPEEEEEPDEIEQAEECEAVKSNFETGDLPNSYHLVSVVLHMGNIEKGHYTCNTFDFKNNVYRKYDDSVVTEINEEDFFTDARTHGYVLMYIHKSLCTDSGKN